MVKTIIRYIAEDDTEHDSYHAAVKHEETNKSAAVRAYDKFINDTYAGQRLLKKHSLTEYGIWKILGEDPNCELSGPHHNPYLGTYEGMLVDVMRRAVNLPGFWTWGGGGDIVKLDIEKIT